MILPYFLIIFYTLIEATALLMGLRILPLIENSIGYTFLPCVIVGVFIEKVISDRLQKRPPLYVLANAYPLPVIACLAGRWTAWLLILSILLFAGLIARIISLLYVNHIQQSEA
ncbi:MAG: hypothetical protein ACYC27_09185 [Armatimonadota bacterium]